jgi:hypothetical protein
MRNAYRWAGATTVAVSIVGFAIAVVGIATRNYDSTNPILAAIIPVIFLGITFTLVLRRLRPGSESADPLRKR